MSRSTARRRSLNRLVAVVGALLLLAAACGDDGGADDAAPTSVPSEETTSTTTTVPSTTAPPPETGEALEALQLNVVEFGDDGYVEIINTGSDEVTLDGIFVCEFPDYVNLGDVADVATLAGGDTLRVPASALGGLSADDGEAAIYNGDDFDSPDGMLSYVQWGTGSHERASVAVSADLWPADDVFVTPDPSFNSIESGGFAADPEGWS